MHRRPPYTWQLPSDLRFQQLLLPYLGPYFVYVALSSLPEGIMAPSMAQLLKLVVTAVVMGLYWRTYRFGRLTVGQLGSSLLAFPVALGAWLGPLLMMKAAGLVEVSADAAAVAASDLYIWLRILNSVILVAVFEEQFMRVYVMQWLHQAAAQRKAKGLIGALLDTLEQRPATLAALPLSTFSVAGATLVFAAGHRMHEYPAAIAYFLFTTWVYRKTGSLWACILIHGLTNLAIAVLASSYGMTWLW